MASQDVDAVDEGFSDLAVVDDVLGVLEGEDFPLEPLAEEPAEELEDVLLPLLDPPRLEGLE